MMFHTIPVARSMPTSSSGDEIAARAASRALAFPEALPCPIREEPALVMMARTSAKSTFTSPGTCTYTQTRSMAKTCHTHLWLLVAHIYNRPPAACLQTCTDRLEKQSVVAWSYVSSTLTLLQCHTNYLFVHLPCTADCIQWKEDPSSFIA